jgi:hypothetical protein
MCQQAITPRRYESDAALILPSDAFACVISAPAITTDRGGVSACIISIFRSLSPPLRRERTVAAAVLVHRQVGQEGLWVGAVQRRNELLAAGQTLPRIVRLCRTLSTRHTEREREEASREERCVSAGHYPASI